MHTFGIFGEPLTDTVREDDLLQKRRFQWGQCAKEKEKDLKDIPVATARNEGRASSARGTGTRNSLGCSVSKEPCVSLWDKVAGTNPLDLDGIQGGSK